MSIKDIVEKVKLQIKQFYTLVLILVIASLFFALGRLSALEEHKSPIKIIYPNSDQSATVVNSTPLTSADGDHLQKSNNTSGEVIGSKNGKKYYFPWCGTVKMIKPENQIKFASIEEAKKAGFVAGRNCKGLK